MKKFKCNYVYLDNNWKFLLASDEKLNGYNNEFKDVEILMEYNDIVIKAKRNLYAYPKENAKTTEVEVDKKMWEAYKFKVSAWKEENLLRWFKKNKKKYFLYFYEITKEDADLMINPVEINGKYYMIGNQYLKEKKENE